MSTLAARLVARLRRFANRPARVDNVITRNSKKLAALGNRLTGERLLIEQAYELARTTPHSLAVVESVQRWLKSGAHPLCDGGELTDKQVLELTPVELDRMATQGE